MNLYLVGYRCAGKTSVGRLLSDTLGWMFVDMDHELADEVGMPIQEIVSTRGWQYFRELEGRLLTKLSRGRNQVIATGGGVVTAAANIATMRKAGRVVLLSASPAAIAERMAADGNTAGQRPPLRGEDALAEIGEVIEERQSLYEQAMHLRVDTDNLSPEQVADRILTWLRGAWSG